jgi:hypothetical protein
MGMELMISFRVVDVLGGWPVEWKAKNHQKRETGARPHGERCCPMGEGAA